MQQEYKVYVLKCNKTDKVMYVGLTRGLLSQRYNAHICRLKIRRIDYRIEMIADELNQEQAVQLEKMLIQQYMTIETGWNKSPGSINGSSNYHSEEQKAKWSKERKAKKVSETHAAKNRVARIGMKNSEYWHKRHKETHSKRIICIETGEIFNSAREAAKKYNLQYSKISLVCNGKRKTTGNLHFKFIETVESSGND